MNVLKENKILIKDYVSHWIFITLSMQIVIAVSMVLYGKQ